MKLDLPAGKNPRVGFHLQPEALALLDELCARYHLSRGAIVTIAIVECYNTRIGFQKPERKKRGNGHP